MFVAGDVGAARGGGLNTGWACERQVWLGEFGVGVVIGSCAASYCVVLCLQCFCPGELYAFSSGCLNLRVGLSFSGPSFSDLSSVSSPWSTDLTKL